MKIFVYGSLKKGLHNHSMLESSNYICSTLTSDRYNMISMGSFPAVIKDVEKYFIEGEVYEVTENVISNLDELEGNGSFYQRYKIRVDGINDSVWMYFVKPPYCLFMHNESVNRPAVHIVHDVCEWR